MSWWGIPWGPIYTIQALATNLRGGKNVTHEVIASMSEASLRFHGLSSPIRLTTQ
jgi:hypothetical protein